jgi:phytoene dehydrogenase-like protein
MHRFPPKLPSKLGYEPSGIVEAVRPNVDPAWVGKIASSPRQWAEATWPAGRAGSGFHRRVGRDDGRSRCDRRREWHQRPGRGAEWWLRAAVTSGRAYVRRDFRGQEIDHLYAPWLLHGGLSRDHAGGGLMTPLFAGTLHGFGLPVVAGGARRFVAAFCSLPH